MLRTLVITGIALAVGYIVGAVSGFRAAVVDYVENDANSIEELAESIYPDPEKSGGQAVPEPVRNALGEESDISSDTNGKGFQ